MIVKSEIYTVSKKLVDFLEEKHINDSLHGNGISSRRSVEFQKLIDDVKHKTGTLKVRL